MKVVPLLNLAEDLEIAGLVWQPEIGDEVANREKRQLISILVDPQGLTPNELRATYLWLPTVEQLISQFEARQAILFHAGFELSNQSMGYKSVVKTKAGEIEVVGESLRLSLGLALRRLLLNNNPKNMH